MLVIPSTATCPIVDCCVTLALSFNRERVKSADVQQQQEQTADSDKLSHCIVDNTKIYKCTNKETVKIFKKRVL